MTAAPSNDRALGYLGVLRTFPGFRSLFVARVISLLGDWFSLIAVIALLREVAGSNPKALSGLLILKLLPIFLAGPLAGVVADRFSRKAIMVITDLVRVVFVLGLFAAPHTPFPVGFTYAMILLQVVASAFFEPARAAALPQLVPDRHLGTANALGAVAWSMVFTLGSALGGLVTGWLGWRVALGLDAATYLVSAWFVGRIILPPRPRRAGGPVGWKTWTGYRDFRDGVRYIVGRPDIATVLFVKIGWGIAGALTLLLTLFGERVYALGNRPDLGVTLLYVARAIGTGIGPALARRIVTHESATAMRRLIAFSFLWPMGGYLVFSWVTHPVSAFVSVMLAHFGGSVLWVYSTVLLQRMSVDEFRGRVMSTDLGMATLVISVSTAVYGWLAAEPGADLRALVRWMAVSLVVPALVWFLAAGRWPVGERPHRVGPDGSA
ncbi:MAG: MFS transporter [bacterium]|nr:MFS transporter [bacterium]